MKCDLNINTLVAMTGLVDLTFGTILAVLYLQSILLLPVPDEYASVPWIRMLQLFPVILNVFQISTAFHLVTSILQTEPLQALAKSKIWFHGAILTLTCLILKFLLLHFFPFHPQRKDYSSSFAESLSSSDILMTLSVWEMICKSGGLYVVCVYNQILKTKIFLLSQSQLGVRISRDFDDPSRSSVLPEMEIVVLNQNLDQKPKSENNFPKKVKSNSDSSRPSSSSSPLPVGVVRFKDVPC